MSIGGNVSRKLWTVARALALASIPAIASAHGGNNDPNIVHACVNNTTKVVRVVGHLDLCISQPTSKAETPAHWDIQGPPGPPGTNGTNGANGIDGTNGVDGTNGLDGINATRADAPCFDITNRYSNCLNGTVTDTVTGLIWLQTTDCLSVDDWVSANQSAAALAHGQCGLTDHSSPGDWRLPTSDEWNATIAQAVTLLCGLPPPWLTDDAGTGCLSAGSSSFAGLVPGIYWSSTTFERAPRNAWFADLIKGHVTTVLVGDNKNLLLRVWPVRSGAR
jgi:hypothetical protein